LKKTKQNVLSDINTLFPGTCSVLDNGASVQSVLPIAVVCTRIEGLLSAQKLRDMDTEFKELYADLFPSDIPHVSELPVDVEMSIKLRNPQQPMVARAYSCPCKYRESWGTLIQQHLVAGRIRPSTSEFVSPEFIVPKQNLAVLPLW
jgi:hypothetical protein